MSKLNQLIHELSREFGITPTEAELSLDCALDLMSVRFAIVKAIHRVHATVSSAKTVEEMETSIDKLVEEDANIILEEVFNYFTNPN